MRQLTITDARERFTHVVAALATATDPGSIRTGFAALAPEETATELIARADNELIEHRNTNGRPQPAGDISANGHDDDRALTRAQR